MARTSEQLTNEEIEIVEQLSDVANSNYVYRDMNGDFVGMAGGSGSGDVVGPASAVDNNFASFNLTTGKIIKDSGYNAASFTAANSPITGATKTKITYDAKGLVTAGADATTADIADSLNKRYVTDANLTTIGNQSGTNTGDNAVNSLYSGLAASKENTITGTSSTDYWNGAKTFVDFATSVRAAVLTGLSLVTGTAITAADSVLIAMGKLQKQITDLIAAAVTLTGSQTLTNKTLTSPVVNVGSDATGDTYYRNGSGILTRLPAGTNGHVLTLASGIPSWAAAGGGSSKQHRITIPGEQIADTANYQGLYFYNDTGSTITISNVAVAVGKAAAGSGAAFTVQIYKSSGTASDGLNTSATALFSSAIALGTSYTSLTNVPTTVTVESGRWVTVRVTASAGATNKASDAQIIITYT